MGPVSIETAFYIFEAIVAISFIAAIYYLWKQTRKNKHQRHVHNVVDSLGVKYIRDAVFPDGIDGLVFIDYLLLIPNGFIVLGARYSNGHLFGGESVDQWSQVINQKTYKFDNPLYANQGACQAVLWNLQNNAESDNLMVDAQWQAKSWVTFSNAGNFPKGIPENVSMIDELKNDLLPVLGDNTEAQQDDENLQAAWAFLKNLSITTQAENKH